MHHTAADTDRSQHSMPTAVPRRLPGKAKPRKEVLREYEEFNAKRRARIRQAVLWQFWAPDPEEFYRWRVQLDCGCVSEVMTRGEEDLPSERQWLDHVHSAWLPKGQMLCPHDDALPSPYRDIVEWGERREVTIPADPVEPPEYFFDAKLWARIRHDEPRNSAFWRVTLSCGHVTEVPTHLDWKPAEGPRRVSLQRQQEMTAEFEEFWATEPSGQDEHAREHTKRMLADGWPLPEPEQQCYACRAARAIVAYQRTGWLVPRAPERRAPKPLSRNRSSAKQKPKPAGCDSNSQNSTRAGQQAPQRIGPLTLETMASAEPVLV